MTTTSSVRDDILARRMFFIGLALLPWLWVVNVLYFWDDVYGPCRLLGCTNSRGSTSKTRGEEEEEEPSSSTALTGAVSTSRDQDVRDESGVSGESRVSEISPSREEIAAEVSKWVKRSALGSIIMFVALVAWMTIIQTNRDRFGPKWFVIPLTDADRTGW